MFIGEILKDDNEGDQEESTSSTSKSQKSILSQSCVQISPFTVLQAPIMCDFNLSPVYNFTDTLTSHCFHARKDCLISSNPVCCDFKIEPPRGKTNNVVFDKVRHKPDCTVSEDS